MKAIALANRLVRDLDVSSLVELSADGRQEIMDALNGAIQILDGISPIESKTANASLYLAAPKTVSIGVANGSRAVTVYTFLSTEIYKTIRISGDGIDNQIASSSTLLHPYSGTTGTVSAIIYSDAVAIPETYVEMIGDPRVMELDRTLVLMRPPAIEISDIVKEVGDPECYYMEANARNQSPDAPAVLRVDTLPAVAYRLQAKFSLAPARVSFADLLTPGDDLPFRSEHIEAYLLPIARGILSSSELWKNKENISRIEKKAAEAESRYEMRVPQTLATPNNFARTKKGF